MALIPYQHLPGAKDPPLVVEGLTVAESYCGDPRCDCVTGHLTVQGIPMVIDVGTGRLDLLDGTPTPESERLRDLLSRVVRGEDTLAALRAHYVATQQFGWDNHYRYLDWTTVKPGEFVTWHEVFLRDRVALLPIRDKAPAAATEGDAEGEDTTPPAYYLGLSDAYCVDARCDCRKLLWTATAALPAEAQAGQVRRLGMLTYDLRKNEPAVTQAATGIDADQLLLMVLGLLQRFPGIVDEHEERYHKIRDTLVPLIAQQRRDKEAQQKDPLREVGRNDPCPCGSGKKFKKCHGEKLARRT